MRGRPRIFGIGLNKTGTTSLTLATEHLGIRTCHHGGTELDGKIQRAIDEGRPLLRYAGLRHRRTQAFVDLGASQRNIPVVDREFPGSRFILSTRSLESWLDSRERHVLANREKAAKGQYHGKWLTIDRDAWTAHWHSHHERVRAYFDGRDDLLEFDVTAGDGWPELAPVLGYEIPSTPFPHLNRTDRG